MSLEFVFRSTDGFPLAGRLHGDAATARAGVLVAPAMGVAQSFYDEFAGWLATRGFLVMTFDYRGMGDSRPREFARSLRGFEADIDTWVERDAAAALDELAHRLATPGHPDRPLHWIGHSLGGQVIGMLPPERLRRLDRLVTVASGSGWWRENVPRLRRVVWALWYVTVPVAVAVAGYFPGQRLRQVGDLPAGVMWQWRRWCLSPDYVMADDGAARRARYAAIQRPLLSFSFTDDEFMSERNIAAMHALYANAPKTMRRVVPKDMGERVIGHFGFFRRRLESSLWTELVDWLDDAPATGATRRAA